KALATLLGKPIPTQNEAGTAKETAKPNQENDLEKRNTDNSGVFSTSPEQKEEPSLTPESNSSDPIAPSDEESTENDAPTRVPKVSADSEEAEPSLAVSPEGTLIETTPSPVPTQAQSSEADAPPRTILGRLGHWMARSWKRLFFKKKQSNEGQLIPQGDESIAKNPAKAQAMMPGRENTVLNEALQAGLTTANLPELQAAGFASLAELTAYMLDYQPRELWKTLRKIGAQAQAHWLETATQGQRHELLSRQPGLPQRVGRMLQLFQRKLAQADFGGAPQLIQTLSDTALAYLLARPTANVESTLLHLAKTLAGTSVPDNLWARLTGAESVEQEPKALHQQVLKPLWEATPGSENRTSIPYFTEEAEESSYYVANAGLILLHAYLPHLFGQLGYLSPTQKFKTEELAAQGAMLLQYIYNLQTEQDEETMALNRALTCLPQDFLLPAKYEPTSAEKALADQMLTAMIEHWAIISAHDLAGFRDTWLWRSGRLTEQEQKYELVVDTRAYDILLDKLPYTLSPAMLPWSDKPIYVQWR
ncbi:MAG: contractile injection system tape measure protein, partial [Bacteroidota bacterium]